MRKLFVTIPVLLLFTTPVPAGPDLDEAGKDVCKCLEGLQNQAMKMMQLADKGRKSGDMSGLMSAEDEMKAVIDESLQCFAKLPRKYPKIDKSDELKNKVMAMAATQCPDPVSRVSMK